MIGGLKACNLKKKKSEGNLLVPDDLQDLSQSCFNYAEQWSDWDQSSDADWNGNY